VRIAHLGSKGIPSRGGTERVVEAVAVRHAERHEVTVYGSRRVTQSGRYRGVSVVALPALSAKHAGPAVLEFLAAFHALALGGYDVVHVHGSENGFVVPLLRLRYPVVTTNHGPAYEREKWSQVARVLIRAAERFSVIPATCATAVAANQADRLSEKYGHKVLHVPNGVDGDELADEMAAAAVLREHGLLGSRYVLFCAARVDPTKGCHTLLEACRSMPEPPPVLIVGDLGHAPGYEAQLRELAAGLDVSFVPRLDDKATVLGLLTLSSLFVFPSTIEAMSMMLLEALALGVLTLPSDIPENVSVMPPEFRTFHAGDSKSLCDALQDLLAEDDAFRAMYARRARTWVTERFDWDEIASAYEGLYRRALASRPARR